MTEQHLPGTEPTAAGPRRRAPWWVWLIGGCSGCGVVAAVAMVAALAVGLPRLAPLLQSLENVEEVTETSVREALGPDVPLYPEARLDVDTTQAMVLILRVAEQSAGRPPGSLARGVGVLYSRNAPEAIFAFYEEHLRAHGWKRRSEGGSPVSPRRSYLRGRERVEVRVRLDVGESAFRIFLLRSDAEVSEETLDRLGGG